MNGNEIGRGTVFWVREDAGAAPDRRWVVEVRHDGKVAAVEQFGEQGAAVAACADLNGYVMQKRLEIASRAAAKARPRVTLAQARRRIESELDAAGIEHERIGGGPLSFGFRPNR